MKLVGGLLNTAITVVLHFSSLHSSCYHSIFSLSPFLFCPTFLFYIPTYTVLEGALTSTLLFLSLSLPLYLSLSLRALEKYAWNHQLRVTARASSLSLHLFPLSIFLASVSKMLHTQILCHNRLWNSSHAPDTPFRFWKGCKNEIKRGVEKKKKKTKGTFSLPSWDKMRSAYCWKEIESEK